MQRPRLLLPTLLTAVVLLTAAAYAPGLKGDFLLDDWSNLPQLAILNDGFDLPRLIHYLSSGTADAVGRPLTLLSYLLDAQGWPASAQPFKRTGVLIHLFNILLLYWVCARLSLRIGLERAHAERSAIFAAAAWGLHPAFVSTTLYAAQRSTTLVVTFFLIALICWDRADRAAVEKSSTARCVGWLMTIWLATTAAILSKANGVVVPLLLWTVHCSLGSKPLTTACAHTPSPLLRSGLAVPAMLSTLLIATVFAQGIALGSSNRAWTLYERVLSQPRALMDYLAILLLPREGSRGVFTDDFQASSGVLEPISTVVSCLAIAVILVFIVRFRHHAAFALAAGTFLIGHLLESGPLNLELYYEHRNYLPALLLFWPIGIVLTRLGGNLERARILAAAGFPLLLCLMTYSRSVTWSSNEILAATSALRGPQSLRAQLFYSSQLIDSGQFPAARAALSSAITSKPSEPLLAFNLLHATCLDRADPTLAYRQALTALATAPVWNAGIYAWLSDRMAPGNNGICRQLSLPALQRMIQALAENRNIAGDPKPEQAIAMLRGESLLAAGRANDAIRYFDEALAIRPGVDACLWAAYRLGELAAPSVGMQWLQHHNVCRIDSRKARLGMPAVNLWWLRLHPELDEQRKDLEFALSGRGLRGLESTPTN